MGDIKEKRIYHTVKSSKPGEVHHMEYNVMLGWMCSCKSYMYRKSCKHMMDMNDMMMEYGSCTECKHLKRYEQSTDLCMLWEFVLEDAEVFNCGAWEEKKWE